MYVVCVVVDGVEFFSYVVDVVHVVHVVVDVGVVIFMCVAESNRSINDGQ